MPHSRVARLAAFAVLFGLAGCGNTFDRLSRVGAAPKLSPVEAPQLRRDYQPVNLPMPAPTPEVRQANSLWQQGARAFFKDQRAARVGDILTVEINIDDRAQLDNSTSRARTSGENMGIPNILGFESKFAKVLPNAIDPENLLTTSSKSNSVGSGQVKRAEDVNLTIAAIVTQVLPNGNLVISGHQEVAVNFERRDLVIAGIVRPEDITNKNTIRHSQIAEARIAYGGKGQISDLQQPRYGQQVIDILAPF